MSVVIGFSMAGHAQGYEVLVISRIILQIVNVMNGQLTKAWLFAAKLTAATVTLSYSLFNGFIETFIFGVYPGVMHRPPFGTPRRAKALVSVKGCFVPLLATHTHPENIVTLGGSGTLPGTILPFSVSPYPKCCTAMTAIGELFARLRRALVRAELLLFIVGSALKHFTTMFAGKRDANPLFGSGAITRTKAPKASGKVMAIGLEPFAASITSVENGWLLFGRRYTRARAKALSFVLGGKLPIALRAKFLHHVTSVRNAVNKVGQRLQNAVLSTGDQPVQAPTDYTINQWY